MAGAGYKNFTVGQILTSNEIDTYLMEQSTMVFATTTARDAAITAPSQGMHVFLKDTNRQMYYDGTAWRDINQLNGSHGWSITKNSTTSLSDVTTTDLTWNTEYYDTDAYHDNSTNPTRVTIPAGLGGLYMVHASVTWGTPGPSNQVLMIRKLVGATSYNLAREYSGAGGAAFLTQRLHVPLMLAAGDVLTVGIYHNSGAARSISYVSNTANTSLDNPTPLFEGWLMSGTNA